MYIKLELLECVYLISAMLYGNPLDGRYVFKTKHAKYRYLQVQQLSGKKVEHPPRE